MIRDATYEDIEKIIPLAVEMHGASPNRSHTDFHIPKFIEYCNRCIEYNNRYFRVFDSGSGPTAFFMGFISEYLHGRDRLGVQENLWTDEKQPMCGIRLSKDFENWCKKKGVVEICFSITHNHDRPRHDKFMSRLGYVDCGTVYKKRINHG
tara:strand:- start:139 stop:591 length:453 start_codon:yes stop_codon:yes gene_type:complete